MTMVRCMVSMLHMDQRCLRKPLQRKCVGLGETTLIMTKQYCRIDIQIVFITVNYKIKILCDNIVYNFFESGKHVIPHKMKDSLWMKSLLVIT